MWRTSCVMCVMCYLVRVGLNQTTMKGRGEQGICGGTNKTTPVVLQRGETGGLQCNLTRGAEPNTTIKWFAGNTARTNTDLHVSGPTLTIRNISKACVNKFYRCEVSVSGKSVCNQTFETSVQGPPAVYIYPEDEKINTSFHDDHLEIFLKRWSYKYRIVCSVDSDSPSNITWYESKRHGLKDMAIGYLYGDGEAAKTKEFLTSGDNYRFDIYGETIDNILSTRELVMAIQVGDKKDYNRTYTCNATNKYGADSWSVKIMQDYS